MHFQICLAELSQSIMIADHKGHFQDMQNCTCFIRHLTSASVKGRGIVSRSRPRSCSQYSKTMKTLHRHHQVVWEYELSCLLKNLNQVKLLALWLAMRHRLLRCHVSFLGWKVHSHRVHEVILLLSLFSIKWNLFLNLVTQSQESMILDMPSETHLSGLLPVTTFLSPTTFGCLQDCKTLSSRIAVTGTPVFNE